MVVVKHITRLFTDWKIMNTKTEYTLKTLEIYKAKHLHTYDLQDADKDDLLQDLAIKALQLPNNPNYNKSKHKYTYCITAYRNFVRNWHRNREKHNMADNEKYFLCALFNRQDEGQNYADRVRYKEWDCLKNLTDLERSVVIIYCYPLPGVGELPTMAEVKDLLMYKGTVGRLHNILTRAKKKILDTLPPNWLKSNDL